MQIPFQLAGGKHRPISAQTATLSASAESRFLLEREPSNKYDPNALKVLMMMPVTYELIGYVPAKIAKDVAPLLDAGHKADVLFTLKDGLSPHFIIDLFDMEMSL